MSCAPWPECPRGPNDDRLARWMGAKVEARMSIRHWPERDRPREKLLKVGATALSEAELLAILLGAGVRGRSALDVARALLADFGSLRALLTAERQRVCKTRGLG